MFGDFSVLFWARFWASGGKDVCFYSIWGFCRGADVQLYTSCLASRGADGFYVCVYTSFWACKDGLWAAQNPGTPPGGGDTSVLGTTPSRANRILV